jgi:hypothetical protein
MPLTYIIDRVQQRMITHADGLITFDDVSNHLDAEERDRGLDLPELIDATNATTDLTSDQVPPGSESGGYHATNLAWAYSDRCEAKCRLWHGADVLHSDGRNWCTRRSVSRCPLRSEMAPRNSWVTIVGAIALVFVPQPAAAQSAISSRCAPVIYFRRRPNRSGPFVAYRARTCRLSAVAVMSVATVGLRMNSHKCDHYLPGSTHFSALARDVRMSGERQ